jgi:predicted MFS family arabinose efflux permease
LVVDIPGSNAKKQAVAYTMASLVFPIYVPSFAQKCAEMMPIPVRPSYAKLELGGSDSLVGTAVAVVGLGKLLCNVPCGAFVQRFGCVCGLQTALLVMIAASVVAAVAPTISVLIAGRILEGAALSLWLLSRQVSRPVSVAALAPGTLMAPHAVHTHRLHCPNRR